MSNPTPHLLSLRAYAKHRAELGLVGATAMAVSKAVARRRLVKSVVRDSNGDPKIADAALADREWAEGTDHSKAPASVKERAAARPGATRNAAAEVPPPGQIPPPLPPAPRRPPRGPDDEVREPDDLSLTQESAREKFWKAQTAEADYRERIGELVDAKEMAAEIADAFTRVKAHLLAVPTRARQQIPHLTPADVGVLDALVREALEELVVELEAPEADDAQAAPAEAAVG